MEAVVRAANKNKTGVCCWLAPICRLVLGTCASSRPVCPWMDEDGLTGCKEAAARATSPAGLPPRPATTEDTFT